MDSLSHCPEKWLDRPIDEKAVDELASQICDRPGFQDETQPWLAIADISKAELNGQSPKDLLKGCVIKVIGGRHRQAAYEKVTV